MHWKRIVISVLLIAALLEVFRYRIYAENWYWHFRHGGVLVIDEYRVPVPGNWFVQDIAEKDKLMTRLDTGSAASAEQYKKPKFHAQVGVFVNNTILGSEKLNGITEMQASFVRRDGFTPVLRSFDLGGETLSCVGGQTFNQVIESGLPQSAPRPPQFFQRDPNAWTCHSSGRLLLNIAGTDADMPQIWEIVSHIRKSS